MAPPNSSPSPPPAPFCLLVCLANSLSWQVYQEAIILLKPGACWTFTSVGRCDLGGQLLQLFYCFAQTFKFLGRSYCCPCSKEQTLGLWALSTWCVRAQAMLYSRGTWAGPRAYCPSQEGSLCPWSMPQSPQKLHSWKAACGFLGHSFTNAAHSQTPHPKALCNGCPNLNSGLVHSSPRYDLAAVSHPENCPQQR